MALPKINDVPKYQLNIPSTKQTITFRPFLVKEQKVLLIALESQDQQQILTAIIDTIKACVDDNIKIENLATFDIEYIFTKIRSKSVGETSNVAIKCSSCNEFNNVKIPLDGINVIVDVNDTTIKINDEYTIKMKYPSYSKVMKSISTTSETLADSLYDNIIMCLDSLKTSDEIIKFDDEPIEEIAKFIDNLTNEQFEQLLQFTNSIPSLQYSAEFKCNNCGHDNNHLLKGISDFF